MRVSYWALYGLMPSPDERVKSARYSEPLYDLLARLELELHEF